MATTNDQKHGEKTMKIFRLNNSALVIGSLVFCLFLTFQACPVSANLEFDPTRSLTAGFPGDRPDLPRVAYNSRHNEYLVVYQYHNDIIPGPDQIHAARLAANGSYIANYVISDLAHDCRQPDVDYDPVRDRYLVVWSYDRNDNGANWDIHGRFVPADGPIASLPSMKIGGFATWNETSPRLAYGAVDQDFFVVSDLAFDNARQPEIVGFRVPADGSSSWHYMAIHEDTYQEPRQHPDIVYNSQRDEFLVVYDDNLDIYGHVFPGHATNGQYYNITDIGLAMTELSPPAIPLPGLHLFPAIAFSRSANYYIILWDTMTTSGSRDIYARYYPGGNTQPATIHIERLDNSSDQEFVPTVACRSGGPGCLAIWVVNHNSTLYTFGREIVLKSDASGELTGHATGFYAPLDNLGATSSWTSSYPFAGIAGGRKNFYLGFTGKSANAINVYGRNSVFHPFPWPMFLPAIINGK
jgi:hypothetical protein